MSDSGDAAGLLNEFFTTVKKVGTMWVPEPFKAEQAELLTEAEQIKARLPEQPRPGLGIGWIGAFVGVSALVALGAAYYAVKSWIEAAQAFIEKVRAYIKENYGGVALLAGLGLGIWLVNR